MAPAPLIEIMGQVTRCPWSQDHLQTSIKGEEGKQDVVITFLESKKLSLAVFHQIKYLSDGAQNYRFFSLLFEELSTYFF